MTGSERRQKCSGIDVRADGNEAQGTNGKPKRNNASRKQALNENGGESDGTNGGGNDGHY